MISKYTINRSKYHFKICIDFFKKLARKIQKISLNSIRKIIMFSQRSLEIPSLIDVVQTCIWGTWTTVSGWLAALWAVQCVLDF